MGRRRTSERLPDVPVDANGTGVMETGTNGQVSETVSPPPVEPKKNRPAATFAAHSDRTTRLEVAVWARVVKVAEGEEYTQYSLSLTRAWKAEDATWAVSSSYRAHDVPVLLYLVGQAHQWCLAQRTTIRTGGDDDLPF
jgi:hypothetical protein